MAASSEEERVAWVRKGWETFSAGDMDSVLETLDSEIEVYAAPEVGNPGTYRGHEEFTRWVAAWNEAWESVDYEMKDIVTVGEHHAVVRVHQTGRGRGSGVQVTRDIAWVFDIRDGLCVHMGLHPTLEAAIVAAREREGIDADDA